MPAGDPYLSVLLEFAQLCGHPDPEYAVAETLDYYADKTTTTVRELDARIITEIFEASYADPDTGDDELIRKLCMMAREVEKRGARIRAVEELHAPMAIPGLAGIEACREGSEGRRYVVYPCRTLSALSGKPKLQWSHCECSLPAPVDEPDAPCGKRGRTIIWTGLH